MRSDDDTPEQSRPDDELPEHSKPENLEKLGDCGKEEIPPGVA